MATGVSVATAPWGKRNPNEFIDNAVMNAGIVNRFSFYDGIKSKMEVPIADATLVFGTDLCVFDPQSSIDISEKELTVSTKKWAFQNCKAVLETTYRSELLKKGQNNAETLDVGLKQWAFMYFAKLSASELLDMAYSEIKAETTADSEVNKPAISIDAATYGSEINESNILHVLDKIILKIPRLQIASMFKATDRDYRPSIMLSPIDALYYAMARGSKVSEFDKASLSVLDLPAYRGFEIVVFTPLQDGEIWMGPLANFTFATDDYTDVAAISVEFEAKKSSDYWWGQFKAGFSYLKSELITIPAITFA